MSLGWISNLLIRVSWKRQGRIIATAAGILVMLAVGGTVRVAATGKGLQERVEIPGNRLLLQSDQLTTQFSQILPQIFCRSSPT